MISITKNESEFLRKRYPWIKQAVLNRQGPSNKKGWLVVDDQRTMNALNNYRKKNVKVLESHGEVEHHGRV